MRKAHWVTRIALVLVGMAMLNMPAPRPASAETEAITGLQERIEELAEQVGRSVVSIEIKGRAPTGPVYQYDDGGDLFDMLPPEFRRFFEDRRRDQGQDQGEEQPRSRRRPRREESPRLVPRGLGSGIIISRDGYVVTNQHVVDQAEEITVTMADRKRYEAKLVGQDLRRDLAVLKIDAEDLPAARFDSGVEAKRGMFVLAIGSPFGFGAEGQASVSFGIVSGTRRSLALGLEQDRYYGKLIQTDAAINPGNSGGALCDLDGRVIGINVAIASRTGGSQGVGFAIPIDEMTLDIIERLKRGESVAYGFLGVGIRNPLPAESETAGAPVGTGAFVINVEPGGPADKAGIRPADLIVEMNGERLKDADDLVMAVGRTPPGEKVKLTLYRSGKKIEVEAEVVRRSLGEVASGGQPGKEPSEPSGGYSWRGLSLRDLTPALRREAGVDEDAKGVFVDDVDKDSPAQKAGIAAGSVINQVAGKKVESLDDFKKAVKNLEGRVFVNVIGQGPEIVGE